MGSWETEERCEAHFMSVASCCIVSHGLPLLLVLALCKQGLSLDLMCSWRDHETLLRQGPSPDLMWGLREQEPLRTGDGGGVCAAAHPG